MRILIIDDSPVVRAYFETLLRDEGFTDLVVADSALQAFDLIGYDHLEGHSAIDLILLDVLLPGMDGIEACHRLKAHPRLKDIPVIIVTATEDRDSLQAAFDAGALDYLTKPPNRIELIARIRSALRLKEEMDRRKAHESELIVLTRQLAEANRELERLATSDPLTGVANRRFFNQFLEREWRQAVRAPHPLSVFMVDIDCFKAFNDAYGHQAGDECLKAVASALQKVVKRPMDLMARYGGEEFVVVLPETGMDGALLLAEQMHRTVAALGIRHAASTTAAVVTVSIGVATALPGQHATAEALIADADRALYSAKDAGRNRIAVAGGHLPPPSP